MKKLLSTLIILIVLKSNGQAKLENDTLYLANGVKLYDGADITLGVGSNATTKEFNFIYLAPNLLTTAKQGIGASYSGQKIRIKNIKNYGNKKRGDKFILVCGGGNIVNYWCEIENAIKTGEVIL